VRPNAAAIFIKFILPYTDLSEPVLKSFPVEEAQRDPAHATAGSASRPNNPKIKANKRN
jgi:hypothetical protein